MPYLNLTLGIIVLVVFGVILMKNSKTKGFLKAFFHFDILIGLAAGLYLVISSVISLST